MKKLCLLLAIFGIFMSLPCYAMKLIVNDNADRIVYSRSSKPDKIIEEIEPVTETTTPISSTSKEVQNETTTTVSQTGTVDGHPIVTYVKKSYDPAYLKYLGDNIKPELVGTTWVFDESIEQKYMAQNNTPVQTNKNTLQSNNQPTSDEKLANAEDTEVIHTFEEPKRYSREAADYYTLDLINSPNQLIPSWIDEN